MLALIEEVRSDDDGDNADKAGGDGKRLSRGGGGGSTVTGGDRGPANDASTNATPPSSKLLSRGGGGSGRASRHNNNNAAAGTKSDADLLEEALTYSRAGAPPPSPSGLSIPVLGARGSASETRSSFLGRGAGGTAVERRTGAGAGTGGGQEEKSEIRATAAALLRRLIVEKKDGLRAHFHKIPFMPELPDLPALAEVGTVLAGELGYQSLGEQLGRLAPLLKDESTEVRQKRGREGIVDCRHHLFAADDCAISVVVFFVLWGEQNKTQV